MIKRLLRAILLDVDGTLYHQEALRCFMGLELCTLLVSKQSGQAAYRIWRSLNYFRRIREELRLLGAPAVALATLQYVEAAQRTGEEQAYIEEVVAEWMYQRPLKYLWLCRRRGLKAFLTFLKSQGFQVGVFSDYPALDKLQALGLAGTMSLTLCATDPEINAFKPHPKGFLHACALWGVCPEEVLYIGDRPEVDACGAANAGMPCVLLGGRERLRRYRHAAVGHVTFSSFAGLQHALTPNR
jgi:HAD superfamily hydrolase (TIGR01549 family)